MKKNGPHSLFRLVVILLLCILGTVVLVPGAADMNAAAGPAGSPGLSAPGASAGHQACYTLDTSRPEWLQTSPFVYLPLVLKNNAP